MQAKSQLLYVLCVDSAALWAFINIFLFVLNFSLRIMRQRKYRQAVTFLRNSLRRMAQYQLKALLSGPSI